MATWFYQKIEKRSRVPTPCHFHLPSSKDEYLNFTLLNFAKENNFTLRDDKASSMFDMKLLLAYGNEAVPTSYSNSNFTLTLQDLIIENENGEATDIDKVYLHNCSNKTAYQSSSLVKNQDSLFKNSYTATFNIPIDTDNKKDTKLIIYSNDLSKTHTTKDIHKRSDTAVISLSYKDKNSQNFCYLRKTSLRDITNNIINVISDNEYPFKTNEDITLKAIYKQEEKDEQGNDNKKYKEVVWGYKVIKTVEYNEVSKSNPKDVVELKDKKGKEITFKISDVIKKDDLDKLKQGGHSIIFFAALKDKQQNDKPKDTKEVKFQFDTNYGKTHMRVDIKKEYEEENKEDENYNVLRIETKDDSGDYIEILVPKDEILFNIEDEDPPLEDDFFALPGATRFAQKSAPKIVKYVKDARLSKSLTREEIVGIFMRLEKRKGDSSLIRLVNDKKELDLLWKRISKGSKFIEKRSVPITNKKTKITTKEDIIIYQLDDGKTIIKYRTGSSAGGETIEMDAVKKAGDKIGNISDGQWKVHIK